MNLVASVDMSKIPSPWQCDMCTAHKKPSNGWFVAWTTIATPQAPSAFIPAGTDNVLVIVAKWDDEIAERPEVQHLCGIECVTRWQAKELAKIYGN